MSSIEKFLEQKQEQKILIDGLSHPDEVTWVKENLNAQVIGVTALLEVRYEWTLRRKILDRARDSWKLTTRTELWVQKRTTSM